MKNKLNNVFFIIGFLAVLIMALTFDFSMIELFYQLKRAGGWLFLLLGMWVILYLMNTLSFRSIIIGSGPCSIPFIKLFQVTVTGFSLNYATPAGLMGGEPYKILELQKYIGVERASSSVLLFAMMHIFSHFLYWLTAVILYVLYIPLDDMMKFILIFIIAFCFLGVYAFTLAYKKGFVLNIISLISHLPFLKKKMMSWFFRHKTQFEMIDTQIASLHVKKKRCFYSSLLLEYVGRILQSFEIFFILVLCVGLTPSFLLFVKALIILAFTSLLANLLFFLPLQLGGREAGFAIFITALGLTNQTTLVVSILSRIRELFWTIIGLLLIKIHIPFNHKNDLDVMSA